MNPPQWNLRSFVAVSLHNAHATAAAGTAVAPGTAAALVDATAVAAIATPTTTSSCTPGLGPAVVSAAALAAAELLGGAHSWHSRVASAAVGDAVREVAGAGVSSSGGAAAAAGAAAVGTTGRTGEEKEASSSSSDFNSHLPSAKKLSLVEVVS